MKRDVVLLMIMLLLVVSVSDEATTPQSFEFTEKPDFALSQVSVPIYEIIPPEVNLTYAEDMAYSLFGFRDSEAQDAEGRYVVRSGNKTFEMDARDGSMWYADYDLIWNVALGIEVPTPSSCKADADAWLSEKGLLPPNYVFANYGSTNVTAWNIDAGASQSKVLQWNVNYEMFLGDISVSGPGEQISVMIGEGGAIVGFSWNHRDLKEEPYETASLIEYESALEHYGISTSDVVEHTLTYYADSEDESLLLKPVYEIVLDEADDDDDIFQIFVIPATLLDPEIEITSPGHWLTFTQGQEISFESTVTYGLPPYTFSWHSDFDGVLSTSQNFSTSSLSVVEKKGVPVPHTVVVEVRDAKNALGYDYIAVFIEYGQITAFPTELTVALAGGLVFIGLAVLLLKRRGATGILFFLLMLGSAFMMLPAISASSDFTNSRTYSPSAPTGAYDDGVKEVGIEWCGWSVWKPLPNSEKNSEGFYNWMGGPGGYSQEFNWGDYSAWERDFKAEAYGGIDDEWVDAVDFVYYQDHGGPDGVKFRSNEDDKTLHFRECRWGDGDLDTIVIDACSPLRWENNTGHNVFERWANTLQGIHMVCGFGSTSHNRQTRGGKFALYMTGFYTIPAHTIKDAWFRACSETEGSDIISAVFYASKSSNPLNPQQDDPVNDHAYGFGYVCTDPVPGTFGWYVLITSTC
ncbi:MAG: DUF6345 domain-containing protein [Candidatus Thorarchaeota archaeon]